jgi:hypothetical protein
VGAAPGLSRLVTGPSHPAGNSEDVVKDRKGVGSGFHRDHRSQDCLANQQVVATRCGMGLDHK